MFWNPAGTSDISPSRSKTHSPWLHYCCACTQGHISMADYCAVLIDFKLAGIKVTVLFHPPDDKKKMLASDCFLISPHWKFLMCKNVGTCDSVTIPWKNKFFLLHLGSESMATAIIYTEWPKAAVFTGSPSVSISVSSPFSHSVYLHIFLCAFFSATVIK